jgi:hypothetical protein
MIITLVLKKNAHFFAENWEKSVSFPTKNPNLGKFLGELDWKMLI